MEFPLPFVIIIEQLVAVEGKKKEGVIKYGSVVVPLDCQSLNLPPEVPMR